jgi:hypothetical protein
MAGTSASYALPSHDRSSGAAVEELRAEDLGEEDIET